MTEPQGDEKVIPEHESPLRRVLAAVHGQSYNAVESLEEARNAGRSW